MVCAIGNEQGEIFERATFPTLTPEETVPPMVEFFKQHQVDALGIACFGPIDPDVNSQTYGYILRTPKIPWRDYDFVGAFQEALNVPIGFDTDVNGSLLGEVYFGAAKGLSDAVYYTIGTGVGAGIMVNGALLHGMQHAEEYRGLHLRVTGIQVLPSLYAFCADYVG